MEATLKCKAKQMLIPFQVNDAQTGKLEAGDPGDYLCTAPDGSQWIESKAWFEANYLIDKPRPTTKPLEVAGARPRKKKAAILNRK